MNAQPVALVAPAEEYARIFALEVAQEYPTIDHVEAKYGYAIDRGKLEAAARVLACPVKAQPPNWQHGRVLYARARAYFDKTVGPFNCLDIGTAKGFSALCLRWAADDAGVDATVTSVDVIDPASHAIRNTVIECDGLKTLAETLAPWPDAERVTFLHQTGIDYLMAHKERVHLAFVDGKHKYEVVRQEARLLAQRQRSGDVTVFDDVQIEGVGRAVGELQHLYFLSRFEAHKHRAYICAVRR